MPNAEVTASNLLIKALRLKGRKWGQIRPKSYFINPL